MDLYFVGYDAVCLEKCPFFSYKNEEMHTCEDFSAEIFSLSWPMALLIISALLVILLLVGSYLVSQRSDNPFHALIAMIAILEGIHKVVFFCILWASQAFALFLVTGISLLCSAILTLIYTETSYSLVFDAKNALEGSKSDELKSNEVKDSTEFKTRTRAISTVKVISIMSSLHTMRLMSSGFFGCSSLSLDLLRDSPNFLLKRYIMMTKF
jgi:hypothetical protein